MKYRVLQAMIVNSATLHNRVEAGEEIEFDGVPGPHLEPIDKEAKARVEAMSPQERKSAGYKN